MSVCERDVSAWQPCAYNAKNMSDIFARMRCQPLFPQVEPTFVERLFSAHVLGAFLESVIRNRGRAVASNLALLLMPRCSGALAYGPQRRIWAF